MEGLSGNARVHTGTGNTSLSWTESPTSGRSEITVGSGNVSLHFPEETKLRTEFALGSGAVSSDFENEKGAAHEVRGKVGSGAITIQKVAAAKTEKAKPKKTKK